MQSIHKKVIAEKDFKLGSLIRKSKALPLSHSALINNKHATYPVPSGASSDLSMHVVEVSLVGKAGS